MIGTYLKCDKNHCSKEVLVKNEGLTELPEGWLIGHLRAEPFGSPVQLHFCSPSCASMHQFLIEDSEKRDLNSLAAEEVA